MSWVPHVVAPVLSEPGRSSGWAARWLGGFWAPGRDGSPVRGDDFPASAHFADLLAATGQPVWATTDGSRADRPDDLIESATRAVVEPGEPVAVLGGTEPEVLGTAEAVRRAGATVVVVGPDRDGTIHPPDGVRVLWWRATAGTLADPPADGRVHLADGRDTSFAPGSAGTGRFRTVLARITPDEDSARRQLAVCAELDRAVREAAGLPTRTGRPAGLVPHGAVVVLPAGCDDEQFAALAVAEGVPVRWQADRHTIVVPAGPAFDDDEIGHGALAVVKAAEHTGWRWYTDPDRARWYRDWLDALYGPGHDAYRPAFPV